MNEEAKVIINGTLVKQLRKEAGLSQEDILKTHWELEGKKHSISRATLHRIERETKHAAKPLQVNILAQALSVSPEVLKWEPATNGKATILLSKIGDGRELENLIHLHHGAIWKVPEVPTTVADRAAIMNMCTFLDEMNGAYQNYPKIDFSPLEQLKREFQCQDLLDDLNSNDIEMFAGTHYRFEPIVSEEPNFLFENSNYASSWQICWAGVMGQDYIDALAEIGNTFMESEGFRDLLAVSFVKTPFQNSEKEDLDSNQIAPKPNVTLATFEIDPVRLLLSRLEKANLEGIRNDTTKYWSDNAIRAMQGSKPLTWSEFRKEIKKKKGHKNTDRG